jgi:hypothetical protein
VVASRIGVEGTLTGAALTSIFVAVAAVVFVIAVGAITAVEVVAG